jgi:ABC-2 type transport system ATP-binding protein
MFDNPPNIKIENVSLSIELPGIRMPKLLDQNNKIKQSFVGGHNKIVDNKFTIDALNSINLTLTDGDRLALVGHNGAGKSTLLRLIAGIYKPTAGRLSVVGTTVFHNGGLYIHQEATGRENIELAMKLLRISDHQKKRITDEIDEFTELGAYLNLPVRSYSNGMRARLTFAISTMSSPQILLIDEGIGAGDAAFRKKVESRLTGYLSSAAIIVFASHSKNWLQKICNIGCHLSKGHITYIGSLEKALRSANIQ